MEYGQIAGPSLDTFLRASNAQNLLADKVPIREQVQRQLNEAKSKVDRLQEVLKLLDVNPGAERIMELLGR